MTKYIGILVASLLWFFIVNRVLGFVNLERLSFASPRLLFSKDLILSWIVAIVFYMIMLKLVEYITNTTIVYKKNKSAE